jgi:uncharacterized protein (TIGR03643 family)
MWPSMSSSGSAQMHIEPETHSLGRAFLASGKEGRTRGVGDALVCRDPQLRVFESPAGRKLCFFRQEPLDKVGIQDTSLRMARLVSDPVALGEIIEMALSDHVSFSQIKALHGLDQDDVKALMRQNLRPGSYRAWRRRVRQFSDRREVYK